MLPVAPTWRVRTRRGARPPSALARDRVLRGAQAGLQLRAALGKVAQQPQLVLQASLRGRVVACCGLPLSRAGRRAFLRTLFTG